ncbi:glycoside hydrolase family 15 protein (plasmid) [Halorussus limi]|uniref:Glycoside hydrolase family 15 protein n=1 Tax=Halorussus limi TaxID=2938695 RepID=A0A8U0I0S6_9EURY|nr:glucodextranase DOMON-like domain-containing protein [Halorussus limi]UPV76506.1 glycoside hydrolase family 15 protein [Halorussus limi]
MPEYDWIPSESRRDVLKAVGAGATLPLVGASAASARPTGGDTAHWTTGEQYGVGTVADHGEDDPSRVWFTLTEGALTQARFPRIDLLNLRTLDFVVADPDSGYAARTFDRSRKDDDESPIERTTEMADVDALVFEQTVEDAERGWSLEVEYAAHPGHDAVLADVRFRSRGPEKYDLYVVADTALSNSGKGDAARVRGEGGDRYLTARDTTGDDGAVILDENGDPYNVAVALAADGGFEAASADVVGGDVEALFEDGAFAPHDSAEGNVALVGKVAGNAPQATETVALGFAEDNGERAAADEATGALSASFSAVRADYAKGWREYLKTVETPDSVRGDPALRRQYDAAAMVLKAVESKRFPGAGVASPSVPWGEAVVADEPADYGYNYVWSRDLYQSYTALSAMGDDESALAALEYLYEYQQREDGFLPQNTFLDGRTRWGGEQMDNISFPQVMAYQYLSRRDEDFDAVGFDYENVARSADYVVANGPATGQERWEEESGYSPSTTAAEIAGLACAARLAADEGERADALVYLALADEWQARTEDWMATETGTETHDETPYYFRINDDRDPEDGALLDINNGGPRLDERNVVDAGFLELVRLGVKPWDDEVVRNSLSVVDDTIRVETPHGPAFYRYNGDGYGEQDGSDKYPAGAPWSLDNSGKGRLWPIFSGERGEYELLAGTDSGATAPRNLLETMAGFANSGRMIPEQVWDRPEPTAFGWEFGAGTGSATPLAWSMAQFVRLAHSIDAGEPVERPGFVAKRYADGQRPDGPSLDVDFPPSVVGSETVTVSGTTDGAEVVVKTAGETVRREVGSDGRFSVDLAVGDGETELTVVAATAGDVTEVGTSVARQTVARVDVGDPVAEFDDPADDDHGPGSYVYPKAGAFVDGAFDIDSFGVYETDESYQFLVRLAGELTNPWGGNAISVQNVQIYLRDPDASGGTTEAREGVNATFEAPYQYRVFAEGFVAPRVEAADGSTVTRDVRLSGYQSIDAIKIEVPKSAVGGNLSGKQLVPLLLGQDGYSPGRIRPVKAEAGDYVFGGGRDDDANPNVIDLVTPDGTDQSEALDYSASERATIPYLSL